jgi:hypothetical protein
MIGLTEKHYAAIGRVAVESCTMDRELAEYLRDMGSPTPRGFRPKLTLLTEKVRSRAMSAQGKSDFTLALSKVRKLIDRRNALAHGVWISDPNTATFDNTEAKGQDATVKAKDIAAVAAELRIARKLLLRLCHKYWPNVGAKKKCPAASVSQLMKQLS